MSYIPEKLRQQVRERAHYRCEYCLMPEITYLRYEPDHIIAEKHGGLTTFENLVWSCFSCNHFKGTDIGSFDPIGQKFAPLFNPRTQQWRRHFTLKAHHWACHRISIEIQLASTVERQTKTHGKWSLSINSPILTIRRSRAFDRDAWGCV